jgi:hypothetical protein
MYSNLSNLLHVAILIAGGVLLLRKAAQIDGYHRLKVFVLTAIFSSPFIFGAALWIYYLFNPPVFICGTWENTN